MIERKPYLSMFMMALLALAYSISPVASLPFLKINPLVIVIVLWTVLFPGFSHLASAWLLGLLQDILQGAVLGEHALSLTLVAFVTLKLARRIPFFAYWQQALFVGSLVLLEGLVTLFLEMIQGHDISLSPVLLQVVDSTLIWLAASVIALAYYNRGFRL